MRAPLVWKNEGNTPLGRTSHIPEDEIKLDLADSDRLYVAQVGPSSGLLRTPVHPVSIKGGEFD
jgi:hypothetical protein